jgi:predicted membrane-bound spermidine synthase/tetratricopeptide (TPR) repeat protein
MSRVRTLLPTVWIVFFISGVAGLIYEVVWARYLDLILGGTTYAHVMVLTAFMGGMAGGAWYFGKRADAFRRPIVTYAFLELAIGAWGLLFPLLFAAFSRIYLLLAGPLGTTGPGGIVNKLLFSVILLAPSTFMMGGTLPILVRAITSIPERVGRRVAGLYFINSLGAVGGALLAGFALIPGMGVRGTLYTAAALNLMAGGGLLLMWRLGLFGEAEAGGGKAEAAGAAESAEAPEAVDGAEAIEGAVATGRAERAEGLESAGARGEGEGPFEESAAPAGKVDPGKEPAFTPEFEGIGPERLASWGRAALIGAGISGMVVMIYEVAWIRLLSTILGSSTYSFTLMLAAFITGIAFGSLIARRLSRFGRPFLLFGISQVVVGAALLVALPLYAKLPYLFLDLQSSIPRTDGGYRLFEAAKYLFCLLIMIPPTLASGAALPLAADVTARLGESISRPVGRIWAFNTMGTILGALGGGLLLIPQLGVELTLQVGIVINLALGLWILSLNPFFERGRLRTAVIGTLVLLIAFFGFSPPFDLRALALGPYHTRNDSDSARESFLAERDIQDLVFYTEDINGSVAVLHYEDNYSLVVNGKTDASTYIGDQVTQTLIAAIPALMVPDAREALVIGLGSGQTAGHLLGYPIRRVEIVEISPGVIEALRFFDGINGRPLEDPRTELITQDAKTYLLTRPDSRYDLILSEPSNPWIAGIGGLFTTEYFTTLREHLELGGVVAQWIHSYQQSSETLASVLMTFREVFPYVTVWGLAPGDLLLVGRTVPFTWNFRESHVLLDRNLVTNDLSKIYINDMFTLLNRQMLSARRVNEITSLPGNLNTDNDPFLEYHAPKATFLRSHSDLFRQYDERLETLRNGDLALRRYLDGRAPRREEIAGLVRFIGLAGATDYRLMTSATTLWQRLDPLSSEADEAAGDWRLSEIMESVDDAARRSLANPGEARYVVEYAEVMMAAYDQMKSCCYDAGETAGRLIEVLGRAVNMVDEEEKGFYLFERARVAWDLGRYPDAAVFLRQAIELLGPAADPDALAEMLGMDPESILEQVADTFDPGAIPARVLELYGRVMLRLGELSEAREAFWDSYRLAPDNPVAAYYFNELNRPDAANRYGTPPGRVP